TTLAIHAAAAFSDAEDRLRRRVAATEFSRVTCAHVDARGRRPWVVLGLEPDSTSPRGRFRRLAGETASGRSVLRRGRLFIDGLGTAGEQDSYQGGKKDPKRSRWRVGDLSELHRGPWRWSGIPSNAQLSKGPIPLAGSGCRTPLVLSFPTAD